jgi:hypothetical protein
MDLAHSVGPASDEWQLLADSVEKLDPEKLSPIDTPKLAATVPFRKLERKNLSEIELSRALLSEISTFLSDARVFQQNRPMSACRVIVKKISPDLHGLGLQTRRRPVRIVGGGRLCV